MKVRMLVVVIALAAAGALQGAAVAESFALATRRAVPARPARAQPVIRLESTLAGPVLVDKRGYTIFMFAKDGRDRDNCAKIKGCLTDWPAVTTTVRPVLGPGVKRSLLGSIPYMGKLRMVTYAGHPLHTYKFDPAPGMVMNIGNTQFGGAWWALNAGGKVVK
jgi:predicted lipoprotein with Yx(FWY)xxD motif